MFHEPFRLPAESHNLERDEDQKDQSPEEHLRKAKPDPETEAISDGERLRRRFALR